MIKARVSIQIVLLLAAFVSADAAGAWAKQSNVREAWFHKAIDHILAGEVQ